MLIAQGLELEDQQCVFTDKGDLTTALMRQSVRCRLRSDAKRLGLHATEIQRAKVSERLTRLRRRIEAWQEFQHLYMPGVAMLRARSDLETSNTPLIATVIDLMLPSRAIHLINCDTKLIEYEWNLRMAQASDILHELQRLLLIRRQLYRSKEQYGHGQRHHTRSVNLIKNVQEKVDQTVEKYRATRENLVTLASYLTKAGWDDIIRPLNDEDIRAPDEEEAALGEGRRTFTWIWRTGSVSVGTGSDETQEGKVAQGFFNVTQSDRTTVDSASD